MLARLHSKGRKYRQNFETIRQGRTGSSGKRERERERERERVKKRL
jgi:hypothetical protein